MGHGHVVPNADHSKARCGGPNLCSVCAKEQAAHQAMVPVSVAPFTSRREEEALKTIQTLITAVEQAHQMIERQSVILFALDERLRKLERRKPSLIVPNVHAPGHG